VPPGRRRSRSIPSRYGVRGCHRASRIGTARWGARVAPCAPCSAGRFAGAEWARWQTSGDRYAAIRSVNGCPHTSLWPSVVVMTISRMLVGIFGRRADRSTRCKFSVQAVDVIDLQIAEVEPDTGRSVFVARCRLVSENPPRCRDGPCRGMPCRRPVHQNVDLG
jgi:hypothetical protein